MENELLVVGSVVTLLLLAFGLLVVAGI
jgi:hypothetical protein